MSFRTILINNACKLSYKNDHLIIRNDDVKLIHLSEINTIIIDSTMVTITSYLISELIKNKIKVIFCDELRNPNCELISYYGSHNTSKKIYEQINWNIDIKSKIWTEIVRQKIINQSNNLRKFKKDEYKKLEKYLMEIEDNDVTNREGHAAKVYFNSLFGSDFKRDLNNDINAALNYGYSIILSSFNKEIVAKGYITQIGINHKNQFNYYNLSCDLMEPFRSVVDELVYNNKDRVFDKSYKIELLNLLNSQYKYFSKVFFLSNLIKQYVTNVTDCLNNGVVCSNKELQFYEFK